MKKTIASIALLASTASVQAIVGPTPGNPGNPVPRPPKPNKACLSIYESSEGTFVGNCDESLRNSMSNVQLNANGCADGQAAFKSVKIKIPACPTFVQL